jgi:hypothetical protein
LVFLICLQRQRPNKAGPATRLDFDGQNLDLFDVGAVEYEGADDGDGWVLSCKVPNGMDQSAIESVKVSQDEEDILHVRFGPPPLARNDVTVMQDKENVPDNKQAMRQVTFLMCTCSPFACRCFANCQLAMTTCDMTIRADLG